ncbi:MAG TPA: serine/threonine-protein kinase, partial [Isosphaeraceae bacterium]|nr:serine/threonine-protein kinase [Isosphaeraceae bacterium]
MSESSPPPSKPAAPSLTQRIDRACDQFEAAWRAGQSPRIEHYLADFEEPELTTLVRELVATEIELRIASGAQLDSAEYWERFPDHAGLVDTIFDEILGDRRRSDYSAPASGLAEVGQDTTEIPLVGLLAVQMGYLRREQLEEALAECGPDSIRRLGLVLVERGWISAETLSVLEGLIQKLLVDRAASEPAARAASHAPKAAPLSLNELSSIADLSTLESAPATNPTAGGEVDRTSHLLGATIAGEPPVWTGKLELPTVAGYEVLGELGRGGMGVVYRARQVRLNRPCALKMILAGDHAAAESTARFLAEAQTVARLRHPNIVQIYAIGDHAGRPYLELEYLDGGSLSEQVDGTPWPPDKAARFVHTLSLAIHEAHSQGIVHRDLKPANVLLTGLGIPKVTDFGLAKVLSGDSGLTRTLSIVGSPSYMAPEQAEGMSKQVGVGADVYSLGAILYELVTGRPPFKAATILETLDQVKHAEPVAPGRLQPRLPSDLETICLKCLRKEPDKRYVTALELADDLNRFLEGLPIRARPVSAVAHLARWCHRNPALTFISALAALATAVAVMVSVGFGIYQARAAKDLRNALKNVQAERRNSDLNLATLTLDRGQLLCEQSDVALGVLWLARALEIAKRADAPALERVIRASLTGWSEQLHPLLRHFEHRGKVL